MYYRKSTNALHQVDLFIVIPGVILMFQFWKVLWTHVEHPI